MIELLSWTAIRRRIRVWRARLSVPSLLARCDERRVVTVVTAINAVAALLLVSLFARFLELPLLFPVLGPTAFLLFSKPFARSSAPRSVILGHLSAMLIGLICWKLTTWFSGTQIDVSAHGWPVIVSAALALGASCVVLIQLSCPHAPACASALIVAMGGAESWLSLFGMALGVVLLTLQAGLIYRAAGMATPKWSPRA